MDEKTWQMMSHSTFMFDLEYIGTSNSLDCCYIWEIGACHYLSGASFSCTIDPGIRPLPAPFTNDFIQVTPLLLKERSACSFTNAWAKLLSWIYSLVPLHNNILWVAHNGFKADKPMLEIDTKRHGIIMPYNWFFLDSLIYCRKSIPKIPSYTLGDIYYTLFHKPINNVHSALPDAIALRDILLFVNGTSISGPIYPSYATSLQSIKWLGPSSEKQLFENNITSLEHLIIVLMIHYSNNCILSSSVPIREFIEQYLKVQIGLQSGNASSISESIVSNWLPGTN